MLDLEGAPLPAPPVELAAPEAASPAALMVFVTAELSELEPPATRETAAAPALIALLLVVLFEAVVEVAGFAELAVVEELLLLAALLTALAPDATLEVLVEEPAPPTADAPILMSDILSLNLCASADGSVDLWILTSRP